MLDTPNMPWDFRRLLLIMLVAMVLMQGFEILMQGREISREELENGYLVQRRVLNEERLEVEFELNGRTYRREYTPKLQGCVDFANQGNLSGEAFSWYSDSAQLYASTRLEPILLSPSRDLVYFTEQNQYDWTISGPFSGRDLTQRIASTFLMEEPENVKKALIYFNASYVFITQPDISNANAMLFSVFQGRFNQFYDLKESSLLMNPEKIDFLSLLYSDDYCWLFEA
jgi:hypothetical protein